MSWELNSAAEKIAKYPKAVRHGLKELEKRGFKFGIPIDDLSDEDAASAWVEIVNYVQCGGEQ